MSFKTRSKDWAMMQLEVQDKHVENSNQQDTEWGVFLPQLPRLAKTQSLNSLEIEVLRKRGGVYGKELMKSKSRKKYRSASYDSKMNLMPEDDKILRMKVQTPCQNRNLRDSPRLGEGEHFDEVFASDRGTPSGMDSVRSKSTSELAEINALKSILSKHEEQDGHWEQMVNSRQSLFKIKDNKLHIAKTGVKNLEDNVSPLITPNKEANSVIFLDQRYADLGKPDLSQRNFAGGDEDRESVYGDLESESFFVECRENSISSISSPCTPLEVVDNNISGIWTPFSKRGLEGENARQEANMEWSSSNFVHEKETPLKNKIKEQRLKKVVNLSLSITDNPYWEGGKSKGPSNYESNSPASRHYQKGEERAGVTGFNSFNNTLEMSDYKKQDLSEYSDSGRSLSTESQNSFRSIRRSESLQYLRAAPATAIVKNNLNRAMEEIESLKATIHSLKVIKRNTEDEYKLKLRNAENKIFELQARTVTLEEQIIKKIEALTKVQERATTYKEKLRRSKFDLSIVSNVVTTFINGDPLYNKLCEGRRSSSGASVNLGKELKIKKEGFSRKFTQFGSASFYGAQAEGLKTLQHKNDIGLNPEAINKEKSCESVIREIEDKQYHFFEFYQDQHNYVKGMLEKLQKSRTEINHFVEGKLSEQYFQEYDVKSRIIKQFIKDIYRWICEYPLVLSKLQHKMKDITTRAFKACTHWRSADSSSNLAPDKTSGEQKSFQSANSVTSCKPEKKVSTLCLSPSSPSNIQVNPRGFEIEIGGFSRDREQSLANAKLQGINNSNLSSTVRGKSSPPITVGTPEIHKSVKTEQNGYRDIDSKQLVNENDREKASPKQLKHRWVREESAESVDQLELHHHRKQCENRNKEDLLPRENIGISRSQSLDHFDTTAVEDSDSFVKPSHCRERKCLSLPLRSRTFSEFI